MSREDDATEPTARTPGHSAYTMKSEPTETTPDGWPVSIRGVTESVVATLGPNNLWNLAALGLHAPTDGERVTATTWGNTRTRRNFHREEGGVVLFTADPLLFASAAMTIHEESEPVVEHADAWVAVDADPIESGESDGTSWERWALSPTEPGTVETRRPGTINRGCGAVIEATVAASRLDVPAYDTDVLLDRLAFFAETVEKCGGPRERAAFELVSETSGWRQRRDDDSA